MAMTNFNIISNLCRVNEVKCNNYISTLLTDTHV